MRELYVRVLRSLQHAFRAKWIYHQVLLGHPRPVGFQPGGVSAERVAEFLCGGVHHPCGSFLLLFAGSGADTGSLRRTPGRTRTDTVGAHSSDTVVGDRRAPAWQHIDSGGVVTSFHLVGSIGIG